MIVLTESVLGVGQDTRIIEVVPEVILTVVIDINYGYVMFVGILMLRRLMY